MSDFGDYMNRAWVKISQKLDQNLTLAREEYLLMPDDFRRPFREWVARVAALQSPDSSIHARARIQILAPEGEGIGSVYVSPVSLSRALEAWDRGEDYMPDKLSDL